MNKLKFIPKKLDFKIVKDGLSAISKLSDNSNSKGIWMLVGGMAVQSYLPTSCRRPTSDIDLSIAKQLTYADFKEFAKPVMEYLQDNGYDLETHKKSRSYDINVFGKDNEDAVVIEFPRRNEDCFKRSKNKLEREIENSRKKYVEGRGDIYFVSSPEDIAIPKIVRDIGSLKRNPEIYDLIKPIANSELNEEAIARFLEQIIYFRGEASKTKNPIDFEKIRTFADTYDIRILSEIVGFNQKYLETVMEDWDVIKNQSEEAKLLLKTVLYNYIPIK